MSSFVWDFSSTAKFLLLSMFSCVLVACGGGGGGGAATLYVSVVYGSQPIDLFNSTTIQPTFSGFAGHTPICSLNSGGPFPPGMTLNSNCSITGIPTVVGSYNFGVHVGALGVSNTVDMAETVTVQGPSIQRIGHSGLNNAGLTLGDTVSDDPKLNLIPISIPFSWNLQITSGSLPPGLTLNNSTGVVSGVATTQGTYQANIQATLTTSLGTYATTTTYDTSVGVPFGFGYWNDGGTGSANVGQAAYISQPFHATPSTTPPGSSVSGCSLDNGPLPAGLSLDATTCAISGIPTGPAQSPSAFTLFNLTGTETHNGISFLTSGFIQLNVSLPVSVSYLSIPPGAVGLAKTISPTITTVSPLPLINPSFSYAQSALGCSLPIGMALNPLTGEISGTPTNTGSFSCNVDVTITNNSFSWTQGTQALITIN